MLWQVVPQSNCTREKGVEVDVDRGLGRGIWKLPVFCLVALPRGIKSSSGISDLVGLGVGFLEGYNFESGPPLRKGTQSNLAILKICTSSCKQSAGMPEFILKWSQFWGQ